MAKRGKKYIEANGKIDKTRKYRLEEAISLLKEVSYGKFATTVELSIKLGVDPRHADQIVRGAVLLPAGTGKEVKVLAFAVGEKEKEAINAGADFVGGEELIQRIAQGWLDFDKVVATPDIMASVGKIGKILGPRGLMPNPKVGTVTFDLDRTIKELKTGKVEFRTDKSGIVQVPVGKVSFDDKKLTENIHAVMDAVLKAKPSASKGVYLRSITLSTTQSPGVKLDPTSMHLN